MAEIMDVIADVAQIVRRAPDDTLTNAYVRAARKFCRESRWLQCTFQITSVAGTRVYDLGSEPTLEVVAVTTASAQRITGSNLKAWPLLASDTGNWNPNAERSPPRAYSYVPEANIALGPALPDDAYLCTFTVKLQPKLGVTTIPDALLVKWDQALQDGALGYLLDIPGQPWSDPVQAAMRRKAFQAQISNAKADEQRQYQSGSVRARTRAWFPGGRV